MQRDHHGDIGSAVARYGAGDWIDLSTGTNRRPWLGGDLPPRMPMAEARERLVQAAADRFGCLPAQVLPVADALAAIPRLRSPGRAAVLGQGDTGHAASLRAAGWQVAQVERAEDMAGADLALLANPGSTDGREWEPRALRRLARRVGHLVLDEGLADPRPDLSLAPDLPANVLVLRDLCPFWGLRGLGLVLADPALLDRLAGSPLPDGRALHVGALALADRDWADQTILYLSEAALRLDRLAVAAGWRMAGGTHLFRLYDTGDAAAAQDRLARAHVWTRRFGWSDRWLRLDIPAGHAEWDRLTASLRDP